MDECLERGLEAERLAIYLEEVAAYQYRKNKELQGGGSGGGSRRQEKDEVVELELWDDPDAMIEIEED